MMVQVNQDGLNLNGTYQILVYTNDISILLGRRVHTDKLQQLLRETGLEVTSDKNKYRVMSRDQYGGCNHNIKTDDKSFERVENFKCLGTKLKNQNYIEEEIKSNLK